MTVRGTTMTDLKNMKCLNDFVVAIPGEKETQKKGILLPEGAQEDSPIAEVVAVGGFAEADYGINVGDHILIPLMTQMRLMQTKCCDLMIDDKPAIVVKAEDVAVVWPKEDA
jgi:co-chaperonin GroES (HSP10)